LKIAIIGCGDIGIRTARILLNQGHSVVGIRRSVEQLPDWLESIRADVCDQDSLRFLSGDSFDIVLYCLAAAEFTEPAYRSAYVTGVSNTLGSIDNKLTALKRFIFVSSTSVFHQNDGAVVDENSPTIPVSFNGRLMLEAENLVRARSTGTVVRFSGIYGPHRTRMIDRVKKNIRSAPDDSTYTNRIHVDDCVGVLAHLVSLSKNNTIESLYLATDSEPCTRFELEAFIASELAQQENQVNSQSGLSRTNAIPKSGVKRIAGSKRCSNSRLVHSGYKFLYPGFRAGYRQVLHCIGGN